MASDKLNYPGVFLLSAGSGFNFFDHVYLRSFKLYDASTVAENHHYQQVRKSKANMEDTKKMYKEAIKLLLYHHNDDNIDDSNHKNLTRLFEMIPVKHSNLTHTLEKVIGL